jgi:putative transposase
MRFQFIDKHRDEFPVTPMCQALDVSPSGYYAWRQRPPSAREMANRELYNKIEAVYNDNHGVYGSPRIYRALKDQGVACSENRIACLMRFRGLQAKQTKRFKATTKRNMAHPMAPNLLKGTAKLTARMRSGWRISRTFLHWKGGSIWLPSWTCTPTELLVGECRIG